MKRIGELTMQMENAGSQDGNIRPFGAGEVAAMSAATSPGTGLAYGLQQVCAAWGFARSSFYAMKFRQQATAERPPAKRPPPVTTPHVPEPPPRELGDRLMEHSAVRRRAQKRDQARPRGLRGQVRLGGQRRDSP